MIPILYDYAEKQFITNGIGRLSDCISATVTEERNGIYELEFEYPITGRLYDQIQEGISVVGVTHDESGDIQPFDVYSRSAPINGIVTFYAHHISYRLSDMVVLPFTATSAVDAMGKIATNTVGLNPFYYWTNKATAADYTLEVPAQIRGLLGGQENSILDVYGGGEYEFDKFLIRLYANRGTDSGVEIRHGKNLTNITHEIDVSDTYNAVVPFWLGQDGTLVMLPETMLIYSGATIKETFLTNEQLLVIRTETAEPIEVTYRVLEIAPLDLSDRFEDPPTPEDLRTAAQSVFNSSRAWLPDENIKVDFVQLWQTPEYEQYAPLQKVRLCDTVSVYYPELGVEAVKEKVIKTVWNVLLERYDSIELGQIQTTLAQAVSGQVESAILQEVPTYDALQGMFDLIRGGLGGYVYLKPNAKGQPEEILIMDNEDISQAVNIIRMNKNGIGFSQHGYSGPFNSAWTIDGTFYADWIKAGIISDALGVNSWNMATGALITQSLRALQYVFVDGTTSSYFKIPYNNDSDDYYLELSSGGLKIHVLDSEITDSYYGVASGDPYIPTGTIGDLKWTYSGSNYKWETRVTPYGIYEQVLSGNTAVAHSRLWPDDFALVVNGSDLFYVNRSDSAFRVPLTVLSSFVVTGSKSRQVNTKDYDDRLLYSYETPTPLFGDIGEAVIDEDGFCFVDLDDIFSETIFRKGEYQVFLQKEGQGDCWISGKEPDYFIIQGTPGLRVAWELKAKQRDYQNIRLEQPETGLDEYTRDIIDPLEDYIAEQEGLLYGND